MILPLRSVLVGISVGAITFLAIRYTTKPLQQRITELKTQLDVKTDAYDALVKNNNLLLQPLYSYIQILHMHMRTLSNIMSNINAQDMQILKQQIAAAISILENIQDNAQLENTYNVIRESLHPQAQTMSPRNKMMRPIDIFIQEAAAAQDDQKQAMKDTIVMLLKSIKTILESTNPSN